MSQSLFDKSSLRLIIKDRRISLTEEEHREKSAAITSNLLPLLQTNQTILVYASKTAEVNTFPLMQTLLDAGKTVVLPIIERETRTLRLSTIEALADLTPSTFDVPEPVEHEHPISANEIEVIILPMVGFDRQGNRLGYGAGYYDRFLASNLGLRKIGLAYSCQEIEIVPTDEYDIRMDMVVTEREVISV